MTQERDRLNAALEGRYVVELEVGRGGMATVFVATDVRHKRKVAIKVLHPDLAASVGSERFLREIEILARLNHPNILSLLDSGQADGQLYYVMPFVEGETLRERLSREGQLPIEDAVQITNEVADALGYAHGQGVVHRDIKPANIMFLAGHAVVTDFGIAQAVTEAGGDQLTRTGLSVGTPFYMSPEQATGAESVDARSDLYSLGCVLYEMVGGEPPYTGPSSQAILSRHSQAEIPSVEIIRPQTPPEVRGVIEKALAKSPADRFKTAEHMRKALSGEVAVVARKRSRRKAPSKRAWVPRIAVGALVLAAAVWGATRLWNGVGEPPAEAEVGSIVILPFFEQGVVESPLDGTSVAQLLSNQLRAGRHRPVNQALVRREVSERCEPQSLERRCGGRVATALGARYFVYGSITPLRGDSVSMLATPVDLSGEQGFRTLTIEGSATDAIPLLDSLSVRLWLELAAEGERAVRLAGISTDEPDALAAFVNGELYLGEWRLDSALAAYETAVTVDTTFALAWYRLAIIHDWRNDPPAAEAAAGRAVAHADRLADRDRRAVETFLPLIRGDADSAETVYRALLADDPDDVLVNYQLGLLLWAYNWRRGRSIAEAIGPLRQVLDVAPRHASAAIYLMWALAWEGDYEAMAALQAEYRDENYWPAIQMIRGHRLGDTALFRAGLDSLRSYSLERLGFFDIDGWLDMYATGTSQDEVPDLQLLSSEYRNFSDSTWLADRFGRPGRYVWLRIHGYLAYSTYEAARGRLSSARAALEAMDRLPASIAPAYMVLLATLPIPGLPATDKASLTARIGSWRMPELSRETNTAIPLTYTHKVYEPLIRPYALGLVESAAGDHAAARALASELESLPGPPEFPSVPHDLAQGLRADILLREGRSSEALAALDSATWSLNYNEAFFAPIIGAGRAVFVRALALQQLGRLEEALDWYAQNFSVFFGTVFLAPAHLHQGEIYEALGDTAQAIWHYRAFAGMWEDADPELQARRREVLRHVVDLGGESVGVTADGR